MSTESTPGFADLGLADSVLAAIKDLGYETPSPIQLGAIPPLLEGRDLIGQAQTGTGKTAAFLVAIFQNLLSNPPPPTRSATAIRALIVAPTRELAAAIAKGPAPKVVTADQIKPQPVVTTN